MLLEIGLLLAAAPTILDPDRPEADEVDAHGSVIIAGYGRFGQIVGRLLAALLTRADFYDG